MYTAVFWTAVVSFVLGIGIRSLAALDSASIFFVVALGVMCALCAYVVRAKGALLFSAVALLACGLGLLRMDAQILEREPTLDAFLERTVTLQGVVIAEPDARERNTRLTVDIEAIVIGDSVPVERARALVIAPLHADVSYGDRIFARGALGTPESFETGEGRAFNYPGFLAVRGIVYEVSFAEVERVERVFVNPLARVALYVKHVFLSGLASVLPEPSAGLAGGITAGDKRGLGENLGESFRIVGLTHIIVLSGYNIMVVVYALSRLFARFRVSKRTEVVAGICIAALFAAMTGFAAASVRAALMASIALFGAATGRVYVAARALAAVSLGMLLWNPYLLVFDPGFQLSVVATWGLIALSPLVARFFSKIPEVFGVRDILSATIATQCAVLPLILYHMGSLSIVSLPANLLVLVVTPFAMLFSAIAGVSGALFGFVALPLALPAHLLLSYIVFVAETLAAFSFAEVHIPPFSAWWLLPVYGVLLFVAQRALSIESHQSASQVQTN